jgi:hypothetical protein
MNYKKLLSLIIILSSSSLWCEESKPIFVIRRDAGGLFAGVFTVINNVEWCEKNNYEPTVYWSENSLYFEKEGHNGVKDNVWEYYFEPISEIRYRPGMEGDFRFCQNYRAPDGSAIPGPYAADYDRNLDKEYREGIHDIISRYIKIKQYIFDKVDHFYQTQMSGKRNIGIHLRGTDKPLEQKYDCTVDNILETANQCIPADGEAYQFLIATDEEKLLNRAKELLRGPVISYDSFKSKNGEPIHDSWGHGYNRAKLGEEVLVEVLLLSKCDVFVHTRSNVSTAALMFNPELHNKVLY